MRRTVFADIRKRAAYSVKLSMTYLVEGARSAAGDGPTASDALACTRRDDRRPPRITQSGRSAALPEEGRATGMGSDASGSCPSAGLADLRMCVSINGDDPTGAGRGRRSPKPRVKAGEVSGGAERRQRSSVGVPGRPTDNSFIEMFNDQFRSECLNAHWFLTLADAREKMEDWLRYYNEVRPHGAIGNKPPISLQNSGGATSPSP